MTTSVQGRRENWEDMVRKVDGDGEACGDDNVINI